MIIITSLFLVLTLVSFRKSTKLFSNDISDTAFSLTNTIAVKGLLAVSIVLTHLTGVGNIREMPYIQMSIMASVGVGMFFLFSGYSLNVSLKRNPEYMKGFLKKRLVKIGIPYLCLIALYVFVRCVFYGVKVIDILKSFANGDPLSNSWYIITILVFYFAFWLIFRKNGVDTKRQILKLSISVLVYIICCIALGFPNWWVITCEMFVVGFCFAKYKEKIEKSLRKRYWLFLTIALILSLGAYFSAWLYNRIINVPFSLSWRNFTFDIWCVNSFLMGGGIPLFLCLLMYKFNFSNKLTAFLGKISLEIYLLHGLIIECLKDVGLLGVSGELFTSVVVLVTIALAFAFSKINLLFNKGKFKIKLQN